MRQLAAVVEVVIGGCAVGTLGAHAVGVVSEVPGGAAFGHASKLLAVDLCAVKAGIDRYLYWLRIYLWLFPIMLHAFYFHIPRNRYSLV